MPRLHSSRSHMLDVKDVLEGRKPIALVDSSAASLAEELGLAVEKVPEGAFSYLKDKLAYMVYRPEDSYVADRMLEVLQKYPIGHREKDWHMELGKVLGYPEEDINYFLERFGYG